MEFFIADTHFGHGNIIKYCHRTEFSDQKELDLIALIDKGIIPSKDLRISRETIKRHDDTIIGNINSVVSEKDTLRILGDMAFVKTPYELLSILDRIKCKNIHLITGNHDHFLHDKNFAEVNKRFKSIQKDDLITVYGQKIVLHHYPKRNWDCKFHESWHLYGHVHARLVNEDNGKFTDFTENKVKQLMNKYNYNVDQTFVDELADLIHGGNLTLDVGVDNPIHKYMPWSFEDVKNYMIPKVKLFKLRFDRE